ncbi:MAG: hypothetical protein SGILL_008397 [Bacillariaceae sp.]
MENKTSREKTRRFWPKSYYDRVKDGDKIQNDGHVYTHERESKLASEDVQEISAALKDPDTKTTRLVLHQCGIEKDGAKILAEGLTHNKTLAHLGLSKNTIGSVGAAALVEALKHNKTLTHLYLGNNNIGDRGAAALAEAFEHNLTLRTLYLYGNDIGDDGAAALAGALKHNKLLASLDLDGNDIGDEGAKAIATALQKHTLQGLHLNSNDIGDDGAKAIETALEKNCTLAYVGLAHNNVSKELRDRIKTLTSDESREARRLRLKQEAEVR